MPIKNCLLNGKPGFKWGDQGTCYTYEKGNNNSMMAAKDKAIKQARAILKSQSEQNK